MNSRSTRLLPILTAMLAAHTVSHAIVLTENAPTTAVTAVTPALYTAGTPSSSVGVNNLQWGINAWLPDGGSTSGAGTIGAGIPTGSTTTMLKLDTTQLDPVTGGGVVYSLRLDNLKFDTRYRIKLKIGTDKNKSTKVSVRIRTTSDQSPYDEGATRTLSIAGVPSIENTIDLVVPRPPGIPNSTANSRQLRIYPTQAGVPVYIASMTIEEMTPSNPLNLVEDLTTFGKPTTAAPLTMDPKMFGLHVNELGSHNGYPALGQEVLRLWGTDSSYWFSIEHNAPVNGVHSYDFSQINYRTDYFVGHNSTGSLIYTLGQTPRWAAEFPTLSGCQYKDTQDLIGYDASNNPIYFSGVCSAPDINRVTTDFKAYVKATAGSTSGQKIKYYEVWNEPGFWGFFSSKDGAKRLAAMTKAAKEALTELNLGQKLIGPAVSGAFMDDYLEAGAGDNIDIFNFHGYITAYNAETELATALANVKLKMRDYGFGSKPIWNTESGASCGVDAGLCPQQPSVNIQTGLMPRSLAVQWANGVSNVDYFFMEGWVASEPWTALAQRPANPASCANTPPNYCTPNMLLTPLGVGFAQAGAWLKNVKLTSAYKMPGQTIYIAKYTQGTAKRYLVWSATDISVNAPANWAIKTVNNLWGSTTTLSSTTAVFSLKAGEPVVLAPAP